MIDLAVPLALVALAEVLRRSGSHNALMARPLVVLAVAFAVGLLFRGTGVPGLPDTWVRAAAEFGVAALAFMGAMQCRISRLPRVSHAAFRLVLMGPVLIGVTFALAAFVVFPGAGVHGAALLGAVIMATGAPSQAEPLLSAPITPQTKVVARVEAAAAVSIVAAIVVLIEAAGAPTGGRIVGTLLFSAVAGFAVGGGIGLLGAWQSRRASLGGLGMPIAVAGVAWTTGAVLDLSPLMTVIGAGIAFSEDAPVSGVQRTLLWRRTEAILAPFTAVLFGLTLATATTPTSLLSWVLALVTVYAFRPLARALILSGTRLAIRDRVFLLWWAGAPGIAAALLFLYVATSDIGLDAGALGAAAAAITLGLISQRTASRSLVRRLVHRTVLAQKPKYEAL